jgi:phage-related protein (TIGR01555 family)
MGSIIPFLRDRLTNIMSGKGTTVDRRVWGRYAFVPVDPAQAETSYRTSWIMRKVIDIPPFDMTREWRDWQAEGAIIEKLEAEESRLQLKAKCQRALVLSRLYGGGALIVGNGDSDPTQELRPESVKAGGLKYVQVLSRWQLSHGAMRMDPADPWFGMPEYFEITGGQANRTAIRLHPSRVIPFVGQRAPEGSYISPQSWFWGDPLMQSIEQAVKNADLAQDGFADLIDRSSVDILKIPQLTARAATAEFETQFQNRMAAANMGRSTYRMLAIDSEEEWDQLTVTWGGIPQVMESFILVVAGAADIPMTRLLGQSPKGLQSTGDGEERDYHSMLKARQGELLRPALERIDALLIPSALGNRPPDIYWEFAPFDQPNQKDSAEVEKTYAETLQAYATTGLLPDPALTAMAKNRIIESGLWPGSEKAFEEAEAAIAADPSLDPNNQDPGQLTTLEQRVGAMEQKGTITPAQKDALLTDAAPRTLYVQRKLVNAADVIAWAKGQGFETTLTADEMHVTVCYSRDPVDWMKVGEPWNQDDKGQLKIPPGGARMLDEFGSLQTATVLLFSSSALCWRHEEIARAGASYDFDEYQPHITITYDAPDALDLSKVEPYRGELVFGPEIFEEINDDWKAGVTEA